MAEALSLLKSTLVGGGVALTWVAVALLAFYAYFRNRQSRRESTAKRQDDLTNMTILFQTMRDVLEEQKDLAQKLNRSLDKKVTFIRDSVEGAQDELGQVQAAIQELSKEVGRVRTRFGDGEEPVLLSLERVRESAVDTPSASEEEPPALNVLPLPRMPETGEDDVIDNWVGLDFAGDNPDPLAFDVPEKPPEEPEDADAAREAFRTLLNLESSPPPPPPAAPAPPSPSPSPTGGGNGRTKRAVVQSRVYEYDDAGMSVAQISKAIGIGKGEVRLILSLRKER